MGEYIIVAKKKLLDSLDCDKRKSLDICMERCNGCGDRVVDFFKSPVKNECEEGGCEL